MNFDRLDWANKLDCDCDGEEWDGREDEWFEGQEEAERGNEMRSRHWDGCIFPPPVGFYDRYPVGKEDMQDMKDEVVVDIVESLAKPGDTDEQVKANVVLAQKYADEIFRAREEKLEVARKKQELKRRIDNLKSDLNNEEYRLRNLRASREDMLKKIEDGNARVEQEASRLIPEEAEKVRRKHRISVEKRHTEIEHLNIDIRNVEMGVNRYREDLKALGVAVAVTVAAPKVEESVGKTNGGVEA